MSSNQHRNPGRGQVNPLDPYNMYPPYQQDYSQQIHNPASHRQGQQIRMNDLIPELERAAKACNPEELQIVLERAGENAFPKKELNKALLTVVQACQSSNTQEVCNCVEQLVRFEANIDAEVPSTGKTALMIACEKGYILLVTTLIQENSKVNHQDPHSRTPIFFAIEASAENVDVVQVLINSGAELNTTSVDGWSPLLKAAQKRHHQILSLLLKEGANHRHALGGNNNTALHIACENGDFEAVQILVEHGADLTLVNKNKETPMMVAQRKQQEEIVQYLADVWSQKEMQANKVKDELVQEEEISQEKERRKQQQKLYQQQQRQQNAQNQSQSPQKSNKQEEEEEEEEQYSEKQEQELQLSERKIESEDEQEEMQQKQFQVEGQRQQQQRTPQQQQYKGDTQDFVVQQQRRQHQPNNMGQQQQPYQKSPQHQQHYSQQHMPQMQQQQQQHPNQRRGGYQNPQMQQQYPQQQIKSQSQNIELDLSSQINPHGKPMNKQRNPYQTQPQPNQPQLYGPPQQQQHHPQSVSQTIPNPNMGRNQQQQPMIKQNKSLPFPTAPYGVHQTQPAPNMPQQPHNSMNKAPPHAMGYSPNFQPIGIVPPHITPAQIPPPALHPPMGNGSNQRPSNIIKTLPIIEELDLSDEKSQKIFILEQKNLQLQQQLNGREQEVNGLNRTIADLQRDLVNKQQYFEQQDQQIMNQRTYIGSLQNENTYLKQQAESQQQILLNAETKKQNYEKAIDQLKNIYVELERFALYIGTKQLQIVDQVKSKFDKKEHFTSEEISKLDTLISEQQQYLNSILCPDSYSAQMKSHKDFSQPMSQSLMARGEKSVESNTLIKMMERYESIHHNPNQEVQEVRRKLHEEILTFKESVNDVLAEMAPIKEQLIHRITAIVQKAIPNSEVQVYGSHATKLCLPWSDIDLVIIPAKNDPVANNPKSTLYQISYELNADIQSNWVTEVNYIENATVPVVKVSCKVDLGSQHQALASKGGVRFKHFIEQPFNIDITQMSDHHNGLECVRLVKEYLKENEVIEPLILVLKHFLKNSNFNDPYRGGLSSYSLFLMIVSFLQERRVPKTIPEVNLGYLLLDFLVYYGKFKNESTAIAVCLPGKKHELPNTYPTFLMSCIVQIDDPLNTNNNVAKSSFQFDEIQEAFWFAFKASFLSCYCECHSDWMHRERSPLLHDLLAPSLSQRKCDSVLSRVLYSQSQWSSCVLEH